jgi:hypothetical protein
LGLGIGGFTYTFSELLSEPSSTKQKNHSWNDGNKHAQEQLQQSKTNFEVALFLAVEP